MRVLGAAAVLLLAGCGGPSDEVFRAEANDACSNTTNRVRAIGTLWGEPRRVQADRAIELAGWIAELRGNLQDLDVPEDRVNDLDSYTGLLAEQGRSLEEINELTAPTSRVEANLAAIDNGAGAAADELGLEACANTDVALQDSARRR